MGDCASGTADVTILLPPSELCFEQLSASSSAAAPPRTAPARSRPPPAPRTAARAAARRLSARRRRKRAAVDSLARSRAGPPRRAAAPSTARRRQRRPAAAMSVVSITQVAILVRFAHAAKRGKQLRAAFACLPPCAPQDNPSMYTNPLQFEIQYECVQHLQHGAPLPPFALLPPLGLSNARCARAAPPRPHLPRRLPDELAATLRRRPGVEDHVRWQRGGRPLRPGA